MRPADTAAYSPLIIALDLPSLDEARAVAKAVRGSVDIVKVGLQLFSAEGPTAVEALRNDGFEVFLDLKMSDIPNTVASACRVLCRLEPLFLTVHATGGRDMMRAAVEALSGHVSAGAFRRPLLLGVTVLTSMDSRALRDIGVTGPVEETVIRLAALAEESGLDGLVASPLEIEAVRREVGEEMLVVTPGVRAAFDVEDDQKRAAGAVEAIEVGADFVVVGRPVYRSDDPAGEALRILDEIRKAGRPSPH